LTNKTKNKMNKKIILLSIILSLGILISFAGAATPSVSSVCCEKTNTGATCINTNSGNCIAGYKQAPTSCESTSFCKQGTCYDSSEGICMENTPKVACDEQKGSWSDKKANELPQCELGCCVIADQAALVPLVRCKNLASQYGVPVDFRKGIKDELACISTARAQDTGACVYEKDFATTCIFTTRKTCGATETVQNLPNASSNSTVTGKKFYQNYLCSAEDLHTNCAREANTGCYDGKVYWLDSCGNRENVYSSDKEKSWNNGKVLTPDKVCKANNGGDKNCGNCDYLLGTRCQEFKKGVLSAGSAPKFGDYYCKKTECKDEDGNVRKNGESWCLYDGEIGKGKDSVGSRHYRVTCVDGEVISEPCADYRNQRCVQDEISTGEGAFSVAACRINRWQDCLIQKTKANCENTDSRDCQWLPSVTGLMIGEAQGTANSGVGVQGGQAFGNPTATAASSTLSNPTATGAVIAPITGNAFAGGEDRKVENPTNRPSGVCVPYFPPGFTLKTGGDSKGICAQANARCIVKYEKNIFGGNEKCIENCECESAEWAVSANKICTSMGDCGGKVNWIGGYSASYNYNFDGEKRTIPEVKSKTGAVQGKTGTGVIPTGKSISQGVVSGGK
jgi:hypothetical protein